MDIRKIKKLIEIIEESGIAEIEIKEGEEAIRISRYSAAPAPISYAPTMPPCNCNSTCIDTFSGRKNIRARR